MPNQTDSLIIKICGSAGDGSISAVEILNRACALMGFHIMNFDSYPAEIRGFGKSVGHTRISRSPVLTPGRLADCLVSLNDVHAITELSRITPDAVILYDSKPPDYVEEDHAIAGFIQPGMTGYGIPLRDLSTQAVKSSRSRNIVALGALAAIYNMSLDAFMEAIAIRFSRKAAAVMKNNETALKLGHDFIVQHGERPARIDLQAQHWTRTDISIISGNEAAAQGALDAGLSFYAGYPITPATKIMEYLAKKLPGRNGVVVQTEDEISAIGHVVGAGYAGKRAMTATSGPGFCLMTETLNLAVEAEIGIVVIDCMRGGPSTGLPTKTEQSDLYLAVYGGSGDSPRIVLAPADVTECYTLTRRAFEVAEAFQTPVIILMDFFLSNRFEDLPGSIFESFRSGVFEKIQAIAGDDPYLRFAITDSGISPVAYPGMKGLQHTITGLEHSPNGFPNYDGDNHRRMDAKRQRKIDNIRFAWPSPEEIGSPDRADAGIISWGSSIGAAMEAIRHPDLSGAAIAGFFPRLLYPIQDGALKQFSDRCAELIVVELNSSGQMAGMVEQITSRKVIRLAEVPAEPPAVESIVRQIQGVLK
ncbi:2-oxoacid:acceptor oxidoreductase subunit alpha [bacterium]|nr:2-oxoacid:acceptor oxidoreductase subunit alpha [candidate division CSSED10-310 bacterium]